MAFAAEWQIGRRYVFFTVFIGCFKWIVLVAAVAGVFHVACRMAGLAGYQTALPMIQWEGMIAQLRRRPGLAGMAVLALQAERRLYEFAALRDTRRTASVCR